MTRISIIGGGAWGTALAASLARAGKEPLLWLRDKTDAFNIAKLHKNPRFLDDIILPRTIKITTNILDIGSEDIILLVVPTQAIRPVLEEFSGLIKPATPLVLCAKGIEMKTGLTVSAIAHDIMPQNPVSILSGPSFAHDVAKGLPTAVTLSSKTLKEATNLCESLSSSNLRLYASDDIKGVELGGALKNVIALAIGMARGKELGASAEAALTTRGFKELTRIATAFDAKPETLMGLSGLGDLMLTCSSPQSRNFAYGMAIGKGEDTNNLKLAEGVKTAQIALQLCQKKNISSPIIEAINAVLSKKISLDEAMQLLLSRPLKAEIV